MSAYANRTLELRNVEWPQGVSIFAIAISDFFKLSFSVLHSLEK